MIRRSVLVLLVALFSCTLSVTATAGEGSKPPTAEQRREARRLFNQAHLAYEDADYEGAILKWKRSYELSGEPLIFEAIAKAYEKLGDATKAYENLSEWRKHAPDAEQERLDRRLAALKTRIDAEHEKALEEQEQRRLDEERRKAREQAEQRKREQRGTGDQPPPPKADEGLSGAQIASWTLIGVGAAAVVAGLVVDAVAASSRPDEETACSAQGDELYCRGALQDDIESSNTLAIAGDITWIAGGALAATGLVLLLTVGGDEDGEEPAAQARLSPSVGPTVTGLMLSGSF